MKLLLAVVLLSVAVSSRLLVEEGAQGDSELDTGVTPASGPKSWPKAACRCVCDAVHSVYKFSKKCYGRVRRFCCNQPPRVGWQPMKKEEERMDFNIGEQMVPDGTPDHNL